MKKLLPVGIQDFEKMIRGNFLYVDKTRYIHEMIKPLQGFYFMARPRRFGKSLLVSTLANLFKGRKELFADLWIGKIPMEWISHPVVKIDFTQINSETPEKLEESLLNLIYGISASEKIDQPLRSLPDAFVRLITGLFEKYDQSVVVLIDEYDKPIIDHLGKGEARLEIARRNREKLKQFFGVLKGGDVSAVLRFIFVTGISKFARVSIFSDLNNLNDLSMQEKYAPLLGYTEEELLANFDDHIRELSAAAGQTRAEIIEEIRRWYDGYRFTEGEINIYNPFSVISLFANGKFQNFWFETATPSFLLDLIRERAYPVADIEGMELPREFFTVYDLDYLMLEPLLFQTGYITIADYADELYRMAYPNHEVKTSFLSYLLKGLLQPENFRLARSYKRLNHYLNDKRIEEFIETVQSIIASIPYTQIANRNEAYYHTIFYLMLSASGVPVQTEVFTATGRLDIAVEFTDKVFVIELKCNQSSEKAIQQILEKRYYERYKWEKREIYLMGINFDAEARTVSDWKWGALDQLIKENFDI